MRAGLMRTLMRALASKLVACVERAFAHVAPA
jgi:hypothetical protein